MALLGYYPEMGEKKPEADGRASLGHYGNHYYVDTRIELKGRGINFLKTLESNDLVPSAQSRVGEHSYRVTVNAFDRLCKEYNFSNAMML